HVITFEHSVQQFEHLNQFANRVFGGVTPGNASMLSSAGSQSKKVGVVRHHHTLLGGSEIQLIRIIHSASACILGGQYVDSLQTQSIGNGRLHVLVKEILDT